jgi:hypothetical protein
VAKKAVNRAGLARHPRRRQKICQYSSLTPLQEQTILDKLYGSPETPDGLSTYLIRIARLGGYLARANDAPPGNIVMWRGICRLTDIRFVFLLAKGDVGN